MSNNLLLAMMLVSWIGMCTAFACLVQVEQTQRIIDAIETAECTRECVYPQDRQKK